MNIEESKTKLLYLASAPYSGSTLLSWLLASHLDIATVGELSGPDPRISKNEHKCACGNKMINCPFWEEISNNLHRKGVHFSIFEQNKRWRINNNRVLHLLLTKPSSSLLIDKLQRIISRNTPFIAKEISAFIHMNVSVIREIISYYKAKVFLDSSKDIDRLQILRQSNDLEIYVLHLVRDGRGQTYSKMKRGIDMKTAARNLVDFDKNSEKLENLIGQERYLRVKYEDICLNPEVMLGKIAGFIGLSDDRFAGRFSAHDIHILGNPMTFDFHGTIKVDNEWSQQLDEANLTSFQMIAGKRNKLYGYE